MSRSPFISPLGWGPIPTALPGSLTILANGINVTGNSTITGTLGGLTGLTVASGGISVTGASTITGSLGGIAGLTIVSGGITATGNSTITGTLGGLTGFTVASGGASVTGNSTITGTLGGLTGFTVASGGASISGGAYTPSFSIGNSGTAFTLDCSKSNAQYVTMNGNVGSGSLTVSNLSEGQTVNLWLTQDASPPRTLGTITGVKLLGGLAMVLSTTSGALDLITFTKTNGVTCAALSKGFA